MNDPVGFLPDDGSGRTRYRCPVCRHLYAWSLTERCELTACTPACLAALERATPRASLSVGADVPHPATGSVQDLDASPESGRHTSGPGI